MYLPILFGSQGGRSKEIGDLVKLELERDGETRCEIFEMNAFPVGQLEKTQAAVFICSTTGDGAAPYNMQRFWNELKRKTWNNRFSSLKFAVVGLGDTSYERYNYAAKRLYNRMKQVGGVPMCRRCDCDDMDECGVYTALETWLPLLRYAVGEAGVGGMGGVGGGNGNGDIICGIDGICGRDNVDGVIGSIGGVDGSIDGTIAGCISYANHTHAHTTTHTHTTTTPATLVSRRKIAPYGDVADLSEKDAGYSEVLDIVFQIDRKEDEEEKFLPGAVLSVRPENVDFKNFIEEFVFGEIDDNLLVKFRKHADYQRVPMFHTLRQIYTGLETGEVRFSQNLSTGHEMYKNRLREVSAVYEEYYAYVIKQQRTLKEVLRDFHLQISAKIRAVPEIFPRYYTISQRQGTLYSITVGIVKRKTGLKTPRKGLCSEYLKGARIGSVVEVGVMPSLIQLEQDVLMVCTGTGVSLPRCVVNEYLSGKMRGVSSLHLIFGFRSLLYDFLYRDELMPEDACKAWAENGAAIEYCVRGKESGRRVLVTLVPSRLREDLPLLKNATDIAGDLISNIENIRAESVPEKNYVQNTIKHMKKEDLDKNIVISGNYRLMKVLPPIIEKILGKKIEIQSESW